MLLFTIYDKSAEEAGPVFNAPNEAIAIRHTVNIMMDIPPHVRSDYMLYCLGHWDHKSMIIEKCVPYEVDFTLYLDKASNYVVIDRPSEVQDEQ